MFVTTLDPRPPLARSIPAPTSPDRRFRVVRRHAPPARIRVTDHPPTPTALDHEPRRSFHPADPPTRSDRGSRGTNEIPTRPGEGIGGRVCTGQRCPWRCPLSQKDIEYG